MERIKSRWKDRECRKEQQQQQQTRRFPGAAASLGPSLTNTQDTIHDPSTHRPRAKQPLPMPAAKTAPLSHRWPLSFAVRISRSLKDIPLYGVAGSHWRPRTRQSITSSSLLTLSCSSPRSALLIASGPCGSGARTGRAQRVDTKDTLDVDTLLPTTILKATVAGLRAAGLTLQGVRPRYSPWDSLSPSRRCAAPRQK
jgi:hypothetical protein